MEDAILDGGHNIFHNEDGDPIKFFIHKSIRPGARVKLTNDIQVNGGIVLEEDTGADTVLYDPIRYNQDPQVLKDFYGLSEDPQKSRIFVETSNFVQICIIRGEYVHMLPENKRMPGRRPGTLRNAFTPQDDEHLARYIAVKIPEEEDGGRTGVVIYKELEELGKTGGEYEWIKRHTWQSWRGRYVNHRTSFDQRIAGFGIVGHSKDKYDRIRQERPRKSRTISYDVINQDEDEDEDEDEEEEAFAEDIATGVPDIGLEESNRKRRRHTRDDRVSAAKRPKTTRKSVSDGEEAPTNKSRIQDKGKQRQITPLDIDEDRNEVEMPQANLLPEEVYDTVQLRDHNEPGPSGTQHISTQIPSQATLVGTAPVPQQKSQPRGRQPTVRGDITMADDANASIHDIPPRHKSKAINPSRLRPPQAKPVSPPSPPPPPVPSQVQNNSTGNASQKRRAKKKENVNPLVSRPIEASAAAPYHNTRLRSRSAEPTVTATAQKTRKGKSKATAKKASADLIALPEEEEEEAEAGDPPEQVIKIEEVINIGAALEVHDEAQPQLTVGETLEEEQDVEDLLIAADQSGHTEHDDQDQDQDQDQIDISTDDSTPMDRDDAQTARSLRRSSTPFDGLNPSQLLARSSQNPRAKPSTAPAPLPPNPATSTPVARRTRRGVLAFGRPPAPSPRTPAPSFPVNGTRAKRKKDEIAEEAKQEPYIPPFGTRARDRVLAARG